MDCPSSFAISCSLVSNKGLLCASPISLPLNPDIFCLKVANCFPPFPLPRINLTPVYLSLLLISISSSLCHSLILFRSNLLSPYAGSTWETLVVLPKARQVKSEILKLVSSSWSVKVVLILSIFTQISGLSQSSCITCYTVVSAIRMPLSGCTQ